MAKKNFFAVIFMMIAMVISFSACTEDGIADIDGDLTVDINGGEDKPADPDTYELITEHVGAELAGNKILDDHDAILLKNDEEIERHAYVAEHEINVSEVTLKRAIAEELQNSTISYVDGKFDLAGTMMVATVTLQNCDKVYFNENGKTYCHSKFVEDGAVAALTCCTPQPSVLKVKNINGNILYADMVISDRESIEYPVEISIVEDDVRTVEYSDGKVISADKVEVTKTIKINGEVTETTTIEVPYKASLECGEMVTTSDLTQLTYGSDSNVNGEMVTIRMNIVSFTASVDMPATVTFVDEGSTHVAKVVYDDLYVTSNGDIKVEDNSTENIDILNTAYFKLVCDGINMAEDDKQIRQTLRVYAEFEKEENGFIYFILHEKEDIRFTAPSGISIFSGNDDEFVVENLELNQTSHNQGSWNATETKTVNGVKFTSYSREDVYSYTHGITNTVKVTKNDDFIIIHNGHEYSVKISEVAVSGAAPVAGNVTTDGTYKYRPYTLVYTASRNSTKAEDETVFTLKVKEDVLDWEIDDYAVVTGRNEVTIKAYETKNGVRTGRVETLTAGYSATLTAGAIITKTSQDILRLVNTTATLSSSTASFSYVLGSESFEDKWNWSASNTATFTLPDGQQTTKPVKADYSVRSTGLNINGNVYSNAASLYADNIAVAEDVQNIQVVKADIDGYKAIAIHVTTAYHKGVDDTLISDGTKYEILYRKNSDHSQYIVRDVTENGALIREYNLKNVDESAYISLITTENGFKPAYLYREFEAGETKKPKSWGYEEINGSAVFGVNSFMALTVYNEDPWIASVYANNNTLGVSYGKIIAY